MYVEVSLLDLENKYSGTEAGRQQLIGGHDTDQCLSHAQILQVFENSLFGIDFIFLYTSILSIKCLFVTELPTSHFLKL